MTYQPRQTEWATGTDDRTRAALEVAAFGAPAPNTDFNTGSQNTGAYDVDHGMLTDNNKQASAIISAPSTTTGRLLNWLYDWADPAFEEPLVASEAGGWTLVRHLLSGQQIQEMRPRLGVFVNRHLWRMLPRYTPPQAAAEPGRFTNMQPAPYLPGARKPPVIGRKTVRWPMAPQTYIPFSGRDPQG